MSPVRGSSFDKLRTSGVQKRHAQDTSRCRCQGDSSRSHLINLVAYPVVDDIPVMVLSDVDQTHWVATHALEHYREAAADSASVGSTIDPIVEQAIAATGGNRPSSTSATLSNPETT